MLTMQEPTTLLTAYMVLMRTKLGLIVLFTLMAFSYQVRAHQPELSTLMFYEDKKGRCFLQVSSSLTAFEGEIDYHYSKNAYKTPQEFKDLVADYFKKNVLFVFNERDTLKFGEIQVLIPNFAN